MRSRRETPTSPSLRDAPDHHETTIRGLMRGLITSCWAELNVLKLTFT